jgi:hypothetical protein
MSFTTERKTAMLEYDIDFTEQRVMPFTTRKLLVRTDLNTPDYEEYEEYEKYNLYYGEFEAFLEAERDFKYTPSLEFNENYVRIGLAHDYEMILSQEDWFAYASWKALGVKYDI